MNPILRILKAVFNFVVGDWILLIGVTLLFCLGFAWFHGTRLRDPWIGPAVFVGLLVLILLISLARETKPKP